MDADVILLDRIEKNNKIIEIKEVTTTSNGNQWVTYRVSLDLGKKYQVVEYPRKYLAEDTFNILKVLL